MHLAIDVGNSQTVIGHISGEKWHTVRISSETKAVSDYLKQHSATTIACASVVPEISDTIREWFPSTYFLTSDSDTHFQTEYINPKQLGADRIANSIALGTLYATPSISIDFGTATKFDVVNESSIHMGGAISIGLKTAAEQLSARTKLLPEIDFGDIPNSIGKSTEECLRSGLHLGSIFMVNQFIKTYSQMFESSVQIVITGGLAEYYLKHLEFPHLHDPLLTLKGVQTSFSRSVL